MISTVLFCERRSCIFVRSIGEFRDSAQRKLIDAVEYSTMMRKGAPALIDMNKLTFTVAQTDVINFASNAPKPEDGCKRRVAVAAEQPITFALLQLICDVRTHSMHESKVYQTLKEAGASLGFDLQDERFPVDVEEMLEKAAVSLDALDTSRDVLLML
ncbi:MAG: hypothetical protein AAGH68_14740 [Pseudomonadota bacterium]